MVDSVSGVGGANTSASTNAVNQASVDYNAFLQLLVAQMKNQDPTEPMDSSQYMAQLASFSNVEQSVQMRKQLDTLLQANFVEQGSNLIGKTVTSSDGSISSEVVKVKILSSGVTAILQNGKELAIGPGVTIN